MNKEDFIKVWSESSKESILNQFYYERTELRKIIDKALEYIELLENACIKGKTIDYILLDTARQLLEDNIEIPDVTIKYLREVIKSE